MLQTNLFKNFSSFAAMALVVAFFSCCTACSKKAESTPKKKKQVVTEMNIQTASVKKPAEKEEAESLPFEANETKEEELPLLGSPD